MNQVQLFSNSSMSGLQDEINSWLAENRDIEVKQTNLDSINRSNLLGNLEQPELFLFYILYERSRGNETVKETAMEEDLPLQNEHTIAGISNLGVNDPGIQASAPGNESISNSTDEPL